MIFSTIGVDLAADNRSALPALRMLNAQSYDVPVLVAARLPKPLGNAPPNSVKYFATAALSEQVKDRTWLSKSTNALNQH